MRGRLKPAPDPVNKRTPSPAGGQQMWKFVGRSGAWAKLNRVADKATGCARDRRTFLCDYCEKQAKRQADTYQRFYRKTTNDKIWHANGQRPGEFGLTSILFPTSGFGYFGITFGFDLGSIWAYEGRTWLLKWFRRYLGVTLKSLSDHFKVTVVSLCTFWR